MANDVGRGNAESARDDDRDERRAWTGGTKRARVEQAAMAWTTECNQTVPVGATGVLVSDLECSLPYGSYAVVLWKGDVDLRDERWRCRTAPGHLGVCSSR